MTSLAGSAHAQSGAGAAQAAASAPWVADRGDGTYQNPVLFADYSDPDAIRVGDDFYLTSSSFLAAPGLPILHSKDLVNWTIINHAFAEQPPVEHFRRPRHGEGVWAPAIRHHAGKFWIFYPDPDFGIYVTTASDPAGEWSTPRMLKGGKGLIDPCPFWDDDGQAYLIHAWARSRAGIANRLTLLRMDAEGARILDDGEVVIDGDQLPGWRTLEGPKMYKRNGYYYVFAPAGGVATGYQAVFRARDIRGPYENRIVLDQGATAINGPHQGAWVDTPSGEHWFLHFQERQPYGRVVHLQPMIWRDDDWPVMGRDPENDGKGEPVLTHRKPDIAGAHPIAVPQTSDEFERAPLGRQWQWNANPRAEWASLSARRGCLRLACVPAPTVRHDGAPARGSFYDAPNFLLQKFPAPEFTVTTELELSDAAADGDGAALAVFGYDYALLGLRRVGGEHRLILLTHQRAHEPATEPREIADVPAPSRLVQLRVSVAEGGVCNFEYSFDGRAFTAIGEPFQASADRWIGAKVGLIAFAPPDSKSSGHADARWFRITPPAR